MKIREAYVLFLQNRLLDIKYFAKSHCIESKQIFSNVLHFFHFQCILVKLCEKRILINLIPTNRKYINYGVPTFLCVNENKLIEGYAKYYLNLKTLST